MIMLENRKATGSISDELWCTTAQPPTFESAFFRILWVLPPLQEISTSYRILSRRSGRAKNDPQLLFHTTRQGLSTQQSGVPLGRMLPPEADFECPREVLQCSQKSMTSTQDGLATPQEVGLRVTTSSCRGRLKNTAPKQGRNLAKLTHIRTSDKTVQLGGPLPKPYN